MSVQVLFFGSLAEAVGHNTLQVTDCTDTFSLKEKMTKEFQALNKFQFVIAVRKQIIKENTKLNNGDVVAFLPPFAGG